MNKLQALFASAALALGFGSPAFAQQYQGTPAVGLGAAIDNCLNKNLSSSERIEACGEVIHTNLLPPRYRARFLALRGNEYFASDNLADALADYNHAIALYPILQEAFVNRGVIFLRLGQCQQAVSDFSTVLASDAGSWRALYGRGICEEKAGDQARAQSDQAQAMAINPDAPREFAPAEITID
ncbi:MAG TPA: tetratricopeptide repeat protein [Rhizomicrobium sp.]|nr:tetratricopeptide repeat protein [Rhizomicrobium sp.]